MRRNFRDTEVWGKEVYLIPVNTVVLLCVMTVFNITQNLSPKSPSDLQTSPFLGYPSSPTYLSVPLLCTTLPEHDCLQKFLHRWEGFGHDQSLVSIVLFPHTLTFQIDHKLKDVVRFFCCCFLLVKTYDFIDETQV